jgi:hypothetical protein
MTFLIKDVHILIIFILVSIFHTVIELLLRLVFQPRILIEDKTNISNKTFEGYYTLLVKGSGRSPTEIVEHTEGQLTKYNPNVNDSDYSLIWTGSVKNYDFPVFSYQNTSIVWRCERNSPCGRMIPNLRNPSPHIYLLIEASTENVNFKYSYCKLKERFVIRLYGLPVKFDYAAMMTISSFGLLLLLLFIYIFTKWRNTPKWKTVPSSWDSEKDKSVQELPKSKSIKSALYSSASSVLEEAKSVLEKAQEESGNSSEEDDDFDEKDRLVQDSILVNLVENNRLRQRGQSILS